MGKKYFLIQFWNQKVFPHPHSNGVCSQMRRNLTNTKTNMCTNTNTNTFQSSLAHPHFNGVCSQLFKITNKYKRYTYTKINWITRTHTNTFKSSSGSKCRLHIPMMFAFGCVQIIPGFNQIEQNLKTLTRPARRYHKYKHR